MERGRRTVQENLSKSNDASLGRVALIHMIINIIKHDFKINQNACSKYTQIEANVVSPKNK